MITEGAGELRETNSYTERAGGTNGSGTSLARYEEIGMLKTVLARPDDTSSRSLAFRPLHYG